MNQNQVLDLLQSLPSEENIRIAFEWMLKKKPTSLAAHRVLREIIQATSLEPELPRLFEWIKDGNWDELANVVYQTKSACLFWNIVDLLENNPSHSQAGTLWSIAIQNCRDHRLNLKASKWFVEFCTSTHDTGLLPQQLLRDHFCPSVLDKARKLFNQYPVDREIVWTLLEFDDYPPAIELATELIRSAANPDDCLLEVQALLKNNPERFFPLVEPLLRKYWNHKHLHRILEICAQEAAEQALPVISDWLGSGKRPKDFVGFMRHLCFEAKSKSMVRFIWSWWNAGMPADESFFALELLLWNCDSLVLPSELIEDALTWLQHNRGHKRWADIASSLIRATAGDGRLDVGKLPLDKVSEDDVGKVMAAIAEHSPDATSVELVTKWLDRNNPSSYSASAVLALCEKSAEPKYVDRAKTLIPTGDASLDRQLLAVLVRAGDTDSIAQAKSWLKGPQIIGRWKSVHQDRGKLMLALIESGEADQEIMEFAKEWLELNPYSYEKEMHTRLLRAVETADHFEAMRQTGGL